MPTCKSVVHCYCTRLTQAPFQSPPPDQACHNSAASYVLPISPPHVLPFLCPPLSSSRLLLPHPLTHSEDSAVRIAIMPSRDCRCTAVRGPLTGKAVLDSSPQISSNRFLRSILQPEERDRYECWRELLSLPRQQELACQLRHVDNAGKAAHATRKNQGPCMNSSRSEYAAATPSATVEHH